MKSLFMSAGEVRAACGCSASKAYEIIRLLNSELEARGYITLAGKVSRAYFNERCYGAGLQYEQRD